MTILIKPQSVACGLLWLAALHAQAKNADFRAETASQQAHEVADWIVESANNQGQPFAILDKTQAKLFVFQPQGQLRAASPVLLGGARGDDSVPGIGKRKIADILPEERTTPAGRFVIEAGRNANGEDVFWVDYEAAVSMHRVRATNPKERRLERLATPTPADNRISYGCINVPVAFFNTVVNPVFQGTRGVVYVLPETRSVHKVFDMAKRANQPGW